MAQAGVRACVFICVVAMDTCSGGFNATLISYRRSVSTNINLLNPICTQAHAHESIMSMHNRAAGPQLIIKDGAT